MCDKKCAPCIILPTDSTDPATNATTNTTRANRGLRSRSMKNKPNRQNPVAACPPGQHNPGLSVAGRGSSSLL
ncbi:hypothetical protein D3C80_2086020 [compost metagenome]